MTRARSHDLLDCPFCGGRPALEFDEAACMVSIACKQCYMGRNMKWRWRDRAEERPGYKAVNALKKMWNYRTCPT